MAVKPKKPRDKAHVNLREAGEREWWSNKLGVSSDELAKAGRGIAAIARTRAAKAAAAATAIGVDGQTAKRAGSCKGGRTSDIRIAGESARFAESFVKLGLVAGDGGSWLLPRVVGLSKAFELALTGDTIDAQQALACGLVSQVVPDAELMNAARALAKRIAVNPPQAVRMTKRLIREGQKIRLDTLLEMAASFQALVHTTADHREAATAFVEKRKPVFRGS